MTKETRIGLLVGLIFIVMFGLVLSELTGTSTRAPAPAAADQRVGTYAFAPIVEEHSWSDPRGPAQAQGGPAPPQGEAGVVESALAQGDAPRDNGPGVVEAELRRRSPMLAATDRMARRNRSADRARPAPQRTAPRPRTYKVQPNDSLIRIARKFYGARGDRLYKLIYQANRHVLPDEATLEIGQELVIPPAPEDARPAARPARPVEPARPAPGDGRPRPGTRTSPDRPGGYVELAAEELRGYFGGRRPPALRRGVYVVRRGDCLTKIARKLLGDDSPAAVRRIYDANRDRLRSPHRVPVGMELQIPS